MVANVTIVTSPVSERPWQKCNQLSGRSFCYTWKSYLWMEYNSIANDDICAEIVWRFAPGDCMPLWEWVKCYFTVSPTPITCMGQKQLLNTMLHPYPTARHITSPSCIKALIVVYRCTSGEKVSSWLGEAQANDTGQLITKLCTKDTVPLISYEGIIEADRCPLTQTDKVVSFLFGYQQHYNKPILQWNMQMRHDRLVLIWLQKMHLLKLLFC